MSTPDSTSETQTLRVALAGNPNAGKTALFNALTGSRQKVANYAGVTVEKKEGTLKLPSGHDGVLVDLPGIYSLEGKSVDEKIAADILTGKIADEPPLDALIIVVDATNLERHLGLVFELRAHKNPMVLALNMMDLAEPRGLKIDLEHLQKELGFPVVPVVATKSIGILRLLKTVEEKLNEEKPNALSVDHYDKVNVNIEARVFTAAEKFQWVDDIIKKSVTRLPRPSEFSKKIDRVLLDPIWGSLIFLAVFLALFQSIFTLAAIPADWIDSAVQAGGEYLRTSLAPGWLQSLVVDGAVAGVGAVLVFLPQILILFALILFLEDSGYLARAAFLMDRLMRVAGLNGRAFIPLLSSYACAIPGIMATRTIPTERERLMTILIAPLTTCSARLPVYSLLVGAFIPATPLFGPITAQGLVLLGLYLLGIVSAFLVSIILKLTLFQGKSSIFVMELPTYKLPYWKNIVLGLYERARIFIRRAGTVILGLSVLIWFTVSFPKAPENATEPAIVYSLAGQFGRWIEPVFQPLGFDWRINVALVPGMAAREVMVSALSTVYAVESEAEMTPEFLRSQFSMPTALSLLIWYVYACQCVSTLAVTRRETQSLRWPVFMFFYMSALAYSAAWLTHRVASSVF